MPCFFPACSPKCLLPLGRRSLRFQREIEQLKQQLSEATSGFPVSLDGSAGHSVHRVLELEAPNHGLGRELPLSNSIRVQEGGSSEVLLKARISDLESEVNRLRQQRLAEGPRDGRDDSGGQRVIALLEELESMREATNQMRHRLSRAEAESRQLQAETVALRAELNDQRAARQVLQNQVGALVLTHLETLNPLPSRLSELSVDL